MTETKQKFERGNLVHIAKDLGSTMTHFHNDKDVIIIGSYADQYGGSNTDSYTVLFPETGNTTSWYDETQLTLLDKGGEHLIKKAKMQRHEIKKQNTDLHWIVKHWEEKKGAFSTDTILFLFDKIRFKTLFHVNGEFFILAQDWRKIYPFFNKIMKSNKIEDIMKDFAKTPPPEMEQAVKALFEAVKSIQK